MSRAFILSFLIHIIPLGLLVLWGRVEPMESEQTILLELSWPDTIAVSSDLPQPPSTQQQPSSKKIVKNQLNTRAPQVSPQTANTASSPMETEQTETASASAAQLTQSQLSYAQQLKLFIESRKHYPRAARKLKQTGLVRIQMEIDQNGQFHNIRLIEGSNHPQLNKAALNLIKELSHFKPLPRELSAPTSFTIPIAYQLQGRGN